MDVKFDLIGITEHKIKKDIEPLKNIDLDGYSPFLYQPTDTTHGGAGFYINHNLDFKEHKDLNFNSTGNFDTIFIELIIPNRKNVVAGCIYRHPSSIIPTTQFTTEYLDPILNIIAHENKTSVIVGDFNIDLLKYDGDNHANEFYNTMTSNFYSPFILQPTCPISKSLIDNIFLNTLEYISTSGNITIQFSNHLFQFVILEGFFKDLPIPKLNIYQRNFKYFNEREFQETLNGINWDNIVSLNASDPNLSMSNFYNQINILLDEVAPYKKLTKKEIKLKSKPWVTIDIQHLMQKRDKLHHKYCQESNKTKKEELYINYKKLRNKLTKMKREHKTIYYKNFFEANKNNSSKIWKGIRSIVNLNGYL